MMEEESKPFEVDDHHEDDTQPDPDENLMLEQGNGRVWLVKMPKFLLQRWSAINAEDVHLATIRIYPDAEGPTRKKPRIVLFLPPNSGTDTTATPGHTQPSVSQPAESIPALSSNGNGGIPQSSSQPSTGHAAEPTAYELEMVHDSVENQVVIAERPKLPPPGIAAPGQHPNPRARTTILTGRVRHECSLRPAFTESYRRQMRERNRKYNVPQRQIMRIEEAGVEGGRGGINRLSSGAGLGPSNDFSNLVKSKPKPAKGTFERMARIPRNQLLDLLFTHFQTSPRWAVKALRERTQQPEAYLKEVLGEIAFLHRSGEYNGLWELKDNYKGDGVKGEHVGAGGSLAMGAGPAAEMEEMEEDEDEDEEDMEEVS